MDLTAMLIKHEGLRLKPYKDSVGKLTIGVGRNLDDRGISQDEAMILLNNDIRDHRADALNKYPWLAHLDSVRQDVIVDMVFNMGIERFSSFHLMLTALEQGDYAHAADEMLNSKWAKQVGLRASELSQMMRSGQYQ